MMEHIRTALVPISYEGYRFVALFAVVALVLFWVWEPLGWIGLLLTAWCAYFFRDPPRVTPLGEGLVVSPADGLIVSLAQAAPPPELGMGARPRTRVSIFMSVFDAHINRVPADGEITGLAYRPGKFVNASFDKASEDNERQSIRMTTADGKDIAFVQVAGLIARRILCTLYEGQRVRTGERFGMIRFGSRVDVYLDEGQTPMVVAGQTALAGETILADSRAGEPRRMGEER